MAKHSLTLSCTKHIILHYRLEPQRTRIYKHQGLINKLFTRAPFGMRLNNIKSDNVSVDVSGQRVLGWRDGSFAVHRYAACSYRCFVSSGYVFHTPPCRFSWLSSYSFIGLQLAGFLFTALLFSPWYVHHVRSHSLGTDSMVKIVQEEEHFCAFRAFRQPTELCQLEMGESGRKVQRGWWSWGCELWCWLSRARWAPSQLDRVVKVSVKDVILYLTLCRPAQLL